MTASVKRQKKYVFLESPICSDKCNQKDFQFFTFKIVTIVYILLLKITMQYSCSQRLNQITLTGQLLECEMPL